MHDYGFDTELVRLAIILGVVVSMLFYDRFGVTTGGSILPGYLALFIFQPGQIVMTLLVSALTYYVVHHYLRPRYMLWGRQLFEAEILVGCVLQSSWLIVLLLFVPVVPQLGLLASIGFVLPGIVAHDMGRQGIRSTLWATMLGTLVVFGLVVIFGAVRDILGLALPVTDSAYHAQPETYAYPQDWLLLAINLSVLMSIFLYQQGLAATAVRTGGFVTAGYLALFANRPLDLLFVLVCGGLTYLLVKYYLMKQAILFGRTKMATMFLAGMIITWFVEIVIFMSGVGYLPWRGFNAIAPTIVALLANDAERQGVTRTLAGVSVSTVVIWVVMALLAAGYASLFSDSLTLTGLN